MKQVPLWFPFLVAVFFAAFGTVFFPQIRLIAFAPFLAILYSRNPFLSSLWLAALSGLAVDLFCSQSRFGLCAFNYCLTTFLLYKYKRHFYEDKPVALSCFTAVISCVSSLIQLCLGSTFDQEIPFAWRLAASDLLIMPCIDAVYAYVCFFGSMRLYQKMRRIDFKLILKWLRKFTKLQEE